MQIQLNYRFTSNSARLKIEGYTPTNDRPQYNYTAQRPNGKMEQVNTFTQNVENKITTNIVLFFDMDGTLVNTNLANFLSYNKAIQSVTKSKHELTYNPFKRFNRSELKKISPNLTKIEYERIIQKKEQYYKEFQHETKLNPVVANILFKYSKTNKTVLVTNCREERAILTLNYHDLKDKFTNFFFRQFSDNSNEKINKYSYAIQTLGLSPNLIMVFENEESEIDDAIQAGINSYNIIKF